ncbi:hypothetical protein MAR621_00868 [Maribacter dokdonensis]|uniref:hypothetical protein n=1 Tax=Maribacter dokdonensis TaxID=320912 RepID=UPI001B0D4B56|nr:hypothetical protein [Maribacter dokdonensis]CAG2534073.1 hypothetical protein MAR621_00868 [Maribacter dokdonensis]
MKRPVLFGIFFILIVIGCNAQEATISEYDLYGCWVLEKETSPSTNIAIYHRCGDIAPEDVKFRSKITLLAFNESEHESTSDQACFTTFTEKGTWEFDENTRIASLYSGHKWLKEFKQLDPEEYASWGSPEKFEQLKFRVIGMENKQLTVEIIPKQYHKSPREDSLE